MRTIWITEICSDQFRRSELEVLDPNKVIRTHLQRKVANSGNDQKIKISMTLMYNEVIT